MVVRFYKWHRFWPALFLVLLTGFEPLSKANEHPLYISVMEMEYNAKDKTLEISCKVFTDDFEKAIAKANNQPVDLYKPKDKALLEKQISTYLQQHIGIKVNGKSLNMQFVGHELEEQSTWSFFQINNVNTPPARVEVHSTIFYELYDKQINIMHVTVGGTRKSTKLDYPATDASFEWN